MTPVQKILLIDTHGICYRAFFAVKELRNSRGQPTNAVFGFVNILKKLLSVYEPSFVAACFDVNRRTRRQEKFPAYKAQRSAMPEDLSAQIPVIKEVLKAYRIPLFENEGYEADDLIATLATRFNGEGREVIIASDDKDMHQLIAPGIRIYNSRRDVLLGPEDTRERFGVSPQQMVDYLALAGDASDNIPGVEGIGEVTARKLIEDYGSLDGILQNTAGLKGKLREKMEQGREDALMSRELATLDRAVPVDQGLAEMVWSGPDKEALRQIFSELEFRGLLSSIAVVAPEAPAEPAVTVEAVLVTDAGAVLAAARKSGRMSVLQGEDGQWAFCGGEAVFVGNDEEAGSLGDALAAPGIEKILYDGKSVRRVLAASGVLISGKVFDVLLAGYLGNAGRGAYTIDALAWSFLKKGISADQPLASAAKLLRELAEPLLRSLAADGLDTLYRDIEAPLSDVLFRMEREGVALDRGLLEVLSRESEEKIRGMSAQLFALAGGEFNLNSPKQLAQILFEKFGLPTGKKTKTGFSTDEEELTRLSSRHELPALILEYRQLAKLKSTYIDALPGLVDPVTTRIHCSFNQAVAETGRLSSSHPNLQNIPIRTPEGRMIRKAFTASGPGRVLLSADYSQIELRVLAHLADEPNLKKAFAAGEDIHAYTAGLMFDVAPGNVTKEMRYSAKRINFGIVYGMSAFGLSKDLSIRPGEAQGFIDRYFLRYPGIQGFMEREILRARERGFVETLFQRRRYIPEINSRNQAVRQFAERQAVNTPVQGTAADIIKIAMVRVAAAITAGGLASRMVITVHDELVFDVLQRELPAMTALVRTTMENAATLSVPINVSVKQGLNWAEMKDI